MEKTNNVNVMPQKDLVQKLKSVDVNEKLNIGIKETLLLAYNHGLITKYTLDLFYGKMKEWDNSIRELEKMIAESTGKINNIRVMKMGFLRDYTSLLNKLRTEIPRKNREQVEFEKSIVTEPKDPEYRGTPMPADLETDPVLIEKNEAMAANENSVDPDPIPAVEIPEQSEMFEKPIEPENKNEKKRGRPRGSKKTVAEPKKRASVRKILKGIAAKPIEKNPGLKKLAEKAAPGSLMKKKKGKNA